MKVLRKYILITAIVFTLFGVANVVSAETDPTNDLWHWQVSEQTGSWEAYSGEKDHIDITNIDYSIIGSEATLTMTLADDIQDSETIIYIMHLVTGTDYYPAMYTNGMGYVMGLENLTGYYSILNTPVSGNTFTATFSVNDPDATYEVRGYAQELSVIGDEASEWWGDWAPNTYFYDFSGYDPEEEEEEEEEEEQEEETTGDDDEDTGTPGFELVVFIAAIAIAILFIRRKK